jgi:IS30 family transposase
MNITKRWQKQATESEFYQRLFKHMTGDKGSFSVDDYVGNYPALQWYNDYIKDLTERQERRNRMRRLIGDEEEMAYPFKTKLSKYVKQHPNVKVEVIPTSKQVKKKYYEKPTFSQFHGTWEIDTVFQLNNPEATHLFCINVNTRYLIVKSMSSKSADQIHKALTTIINENLEYEFNQFKGDGDPSYEAQKPWLEDIGITTYFSSSKFTYHNKIVDVAIKTIRNAIGYRKINERQLQQIIEYYNNTYHKSIDGTPQEMMDDPEHIAEDQYIRYCIERLNEVKRRQQSEGLLSYEAGNILLLHCDLGKTAQNFEKRRRFWDRIGQFIRYEHGNVVALLLGGGILGVGKRIELPVQYTKLIAKNKKEIPDYYRNYYVFT